MIYLPIRINIPDTTAKQDNNNPNEGMGRSTSADAPEMINHSPKSRNPIFFVIFILSSFV
jgi:hypothetical protein